MQPLDVLLQLDLVARGIGSGSVVGGVRGILGIGGHAANTILGRLGSEQQREHLCHHGERLAIALVVEARLAEAALAIPGG